MADANPAQSDRQFSVVIERMARRHTGIMLACGRDRPSAEMKFFWQVNETEDYDGERASAVWPRRGRERWVELGVAKTASSALIAATKAMRGALS